MNYMIGCFRFLIWLFLTSMLVCRCVLEVGIYVFSHQNEEVFPQAIIIIDNAILGEESSQFSRQELFDLHDLVIFASKSHAVEKMVWKTDCSILVFVTILILFRRRKTLEVSSCIRKAKQQPQS